MSNKKTGNAYPSQAHGRFPQPAYFSVLCCVLCLVCLPSVFCALCLCIWIVHSFFTGARRNKYVLAMTKTSKNNMEFGAEFFMRTFNHRGG